MSIIRTNKFQTVAGATMGTVLQTQVVTTTTELSYTNSNGEFFYGTITPFFATSKILTIVSWCWDSTNPNGHYSIRRSADNGVNYTVVPGQDTPTSTNGNTGFYSADERMGGLYDVKLVTFSILDSPSTTSSLRYQLYWNHVVQNGGTTYFNRPEGRGSDAAASTMILMEIAQ